MELERFDSRLEACDWRYAAALVGLHKYLQYFGMRGQDYEFTEEALFYNREDITKDRYLEFAEYHYGKDFHHKLVEQWLFSNEFTDDSVKKINELLAKNTVLKKVFSGIRFDGSNREEVLDQINENRSLLILETFRNKSDMYANFCNKGQLFGEKKECCRLLGYYVDGGRKSKSISYGFDVNTFVGEDHILFDFIPFAFVGEREVFFINNSFSVKELIAVNAKYENDIRAEVETSEGRSKDARKTLFTAIKESADFIDYDVEVMVKSRDREFFETMFIRKDSIRVLRDIKDYEVFCFSKKINENYYLNVQKIVQNCILNLVRTDELIELFIKEKSQYLVSQLIYLNFLIGGGGENMKKSMEVAYACAKSAAEKLPENKRVSYRQKLTSAVIFNDYDRCLKILLQMSNYCNLSFDFVYTLLEDFEENKDIIYTFINALTRKNEQAGN